MFNQNYIPFAYRIEGNFGRFRKGKISKNISTLDFQKFISEITLDSKIEKIKLPKIFRYTVYVLECKLNINDFCYITSSRLLGSQVCRVFIGVLYACAWFLEIAFVLEVNVCICVCVCVCVRVSALRGLITTHVK